MIAPSRLLIDQGLFLDDGQFSIHLIGIFGVNILGCLRSSPKLPQSCFWALDLFPKLPMWLWSILSELVLYPFFPYLWIIFPVSNHFYLIFSFPSFLIFFSHMFFSKLHRRQIQEPLYMTFMMLFFQTLLAKFELGLKDYFWDQDSCYYLGISIFPWNEEIFPFPFDSFDLCKQDFQYMIWSFWVKTLNVVLILLLWNPWKVFYVPYTKVVASSAEDHTLRWIIHWSDR